MDTYVAITKSNYLWYKLATSSTPHVHTMKSAMKCVHTHEDPCTRVATLVCTHTHIYQLKSMHTCAT